MKNYKVCPTCGDNKPISEFRSTECKSCRNERYKKWLYTIDGLIWTMKKVVILKSTIQELEPRPFKETEYEQLIYQNEDILDSLYYQWLESDFDKKLKPKLKKINKKGKYNVENLYISV